MRIQSINGYNTRNFAANPRSNANQNVNFGRFKDALARIKVRSNTQDYYTRWGGYRKVTECDEYDIYTNNDDLSLRVKPNEDYFYNRPPQDRKLAEDLLDYFLKVEPEKDGSRILSRFDSIDYLASACSVAYTLFDRPDDIREKYKVSSSNGDDIREARVWDDACGGNYIMF